MALFCRFSVCHARGHLYYIWIPWQVCKFAILCKRISLALHKQHLQVALKLQAEKAEIIAPS